MPWKEGPTSLTTCNSRDQISVAVLSISSFGSVCPSSGSEGVKFFATTEHRRNLATKKRWVHSNGNACCNAIAKWRESMCDGHDDGKRTRSKAVDLSKRRPRRTSIGRRRGWTSSVCRLQHVLAPLLSMVTQKLGLFLKQMSRQEFKLVKPRRKWLPAVVMVLLLEDQRASTRTRNVDNDGNV